MTIYHFFDRDEVPFSYLTPTRWIGPIALPYDTPLTAHEYLQFAEKDMEDPTDRGLINAFGNIKRALHLTIDSALQQYGLLFHTRKSNFPQRLDCSTPLGCFQRGYSTRT